MDANLFFKNVVIAAIFLGLIALAALGFRPGSVSTADQGGGGFSSSWGDDD